VIRVSHRSMLPAKTGHGNRRICELSQTEGATGFRNSFPLLGDQVVSNGTHLPPAQYLFHTLIQQELS